MQHLKTGNNMKLATTEAVPWSYRPMSGPAHKPQVHFTAAAEFNWVTDVRNCNVRKLFSVCLID
jgi:hypothetical protein